MDTMTIERETETRTIEFVPALLPSDLFQQTIDRGFRLRGGVYGEATHRYGCAVGVLYQGLIDQGVLEDTNAYGLGSALIYNKILTALPMLDTEPTEGYRSGCACCSPTILRVLENGFEHHGWDARRCIMFLREQGC